MIRKKADKEVARYTTILQRMQSTKTRKISCNAITSCIDFICFILDALLLDATGFSLKTFPNEFPQPIFFITKLFYLLVFVNIAPINTSPLQASLSIVNVYRFLLTSENYHGMIQPYGYQIKYFCFPTWQQGV